jgi:hypothetical protein
MATKKHPTRGRANIQDIGTIKTRLHQCLPDLAQRYHVQTLGIFGSYVRYEQRQSSDLDILVSFTDPPSLFTFIALKNELTDLLGVNVDLVMRDALRPTIGAHILSEVVAV